MIDSQNTSNHPQDAHSEMVDAAMRKAAIDATVIAKRTGTPVITSENGLLARVDPDEMARRLGILSDLPPNAPVK